MRLLTRAFVAGLVLVVCVSGAAAQDLIAEEFKKLEGGWLVVAAEQRGKPFDAIRGGALVIEGRRFLLRTAAKNELKGVNSPSELLANCVSDSNVRNSSGVFSHCVGRLRRHEGAGRRGRAKGGRRTS